MKKLSGLTFLVISLLLVSTMTVYASTDANPHPDKTPGAQATQNAITPHGNGQQNSAAGKDNKPQNYRGTLTAVSADAITLETSDGSSIVFALDAETRVKVPTLGNSSTAENLLTGQNVIVRARQNQEEVLTAISVSVIPGKPQLVHRVGTISAYSAGEQITITDKEGQEFTFLLTDSTKILPADQLDQLQVGVLVTIICPRDVTGGPLTANGIVIHTASSLSEATDEAEIEETAIEATELPTEAAPTETPEP